VSSRGVVRPELLEVAGVVCARLVERWGIEDFVPRSVHEDRLVVEIRRRTTPPGRITCLPKIEGPVLTTR